MTEKESPKHSPLPWNVLTVGGGRRDIGLTDNVPHSPLYRVARDMTKTDAQLIVRAVHSHEVARTTVVILSQLIEALVKKPDYVKGAEEACARLDQLHIQQLCLEGLQKVRKFQEMDREQD